jgi:hypothetical protein
VNLQQGAGGVRRVTRHRAARHLISPHTHLEGQGGMWDKMMSVMDNWYFIGGCILALVVLIGLYLFLRNNRKDED